MIELLLALRLGPPERRCHQQVERRRRQIRHHLRITLHQPAVAVPSEPRIAGQANQALDGFLVQADIQHGLHHARHGDSSPRTNGDEQRPMRRTKSQAGRGFQPGDTLGQRVLQNWFVCRLRAPAPGRGQHESRGYRKANLRHPHQVPGLVADLLRAALRRRCSGQNWVELSHGSHPQARVRAG